MQIHDRWLLAVVSSLVASTLLAPEAHADGGLFISSESTTEIEGGTQADAVSSNMVSSNGQRAVYWLRDDGCWDLYIDPGQVRVSGAAWLIPLPVVPDEIAPASAQFIEELDAATQPLLLTHFTRNITTTYYETGGGGGGGCFGADMAANGGYEQIDSEPQESSTTAPVVTVWEQGRIGALDYGVVSAESSEALMGWLTSEGYEVSEGMGPIIDEYVEEEAAFFVVQMVREEEDSSRVPVFRFTLCDLTNPVYPLRLTTQSVASQLQFTLFVVTPGLEATYTSANAAAVDFGEFYQEDLVTYDGEEPPDFSAAYTTRRHMIVGDHAVRTLAIEHAALVSEATVRRRVDQLGEDEEFPLTVDASSRTEELRDITTNSRWVLRLMGEFSIAQMDEDLVLQSGDVSYDPAIYEREILTYEYHEVWNDSDDDDEEETPAEPAFGDASCAAARGIHVTARELSVTALFALFLVIARRQLRRRG